MDIHSQIDALAFTNWRCRAILHAMADAGRLPVLECQLPECYMDDREFVQQSGGRGHNSKGLVIDHIIPRLQGGSDRLENLRAIHGNCNIHRARGWKMSDEAKAKLSAAAKARASWRPAVEKRAPGWNCKVRPDDRRTGGNRVRVLEAAHVLAIRARCLKGERLRDIAAYYGVSTGTIMAARDGKGAYANMEAA